MVMMAVLKDNGDKIDNTGLDPITVAKTTYNFNVMLVMCEIHSSYGHIILCN